jgi:predicted 2-oxoglutarate/Fe(II)-dependent dioxygenase YbiX
MRVVSFFRLRSMVRDVDARSLIFDLDIVIQACGTGLGEMTLKRSN